MNVLVGSDERFVPGLAVTLRSLADHLGGGRSVRAFVLDAGITDRSRGLIDTTLAGTAVELAWLRVDTSMFDDLPVVAHFSRAVYASLVFDRLVPPDVTRLLKLDVDVLVRDDVGALYDTDLRGAVLGAVPDLWVHKVRLALPEHESDGIPGDASYFNSGIQLVDVARWRAEDVGRRALALKRERRERLPMQDQALLNTLLWDRWTILPLRWNVGHSLYRFRSGDSSPFPADTFDEARRDPGIVHFTGSAKPWLPACPHPFTREWRAVRRRTALPARLDSAWMTATQPVSVAARAGALVRRIALGSEVFWRVRPPISVAKARVGARRRTLR